jgi:glycosyltransferase involved in cell wall biosynthesis
MTAAPAWARGRVGRITWEQTGLVRALRNSEAQLLHSAAYAMPAVCALPTVVTVHDLSFFRLPRTFPARQGAYLRAATRHSARRAAALIAVSDFTRRELISLLGVDPARVHVVHNGLDDSFRRLAPKAVERWRAEQGLPERFILSVGTLQPRKNLGTLLRAYARLRQDWTPAGEPPALVVAGGAGWGDTDIAARATAIGIGEQVHVTGYVPGEDMPWLYNAAEILAFPSRYEGFGLPALEAMACGTPVVASDATSLPEVVGEAGVLVPPEDVAAWAAALATLADDPARRRALAARGRERARTFSWARAADETLAVWREVIAAHGRRTRAVAALPGVAREVPPQEDEMDGASVPRMERSVVGDEVYDGRA